MKHLVEIQDVVKYLKGKNVQVQQVNFVDEKFVTRGIDVMEQEDADMLAHMDILKKEIVEGIGEGLIQEANGRSVSLFLLEQFMKQPIEGSTNKVFSFKIRVKFE